MCKIEDKDREKRVIFIFIKVIILAKLYIEAMKESLIGYKA